MTLLFREIHLLNPYRGIMEAPARTARRLLFGFGIALLLATAFALIDGRLPPSECPEETYNCTASNEFGWFLPAATILTLFSGYLLHLGIEKGFNFSIIENVPCRRFLYPERVNINGYFRFTRRKPSFGCLGRLRTGFVII